MSRTGLPAGASLAFFMASSNFLARMSSLWVSWKKESANLSSRFRLCSSRMLEALLRSTSGPGFAGATCERTAPKIGSITSLAWQQGQVTFRFSPSLRPMAYSLLQNAPQTEAEPFGRLWGGLGSREDARSGPAEKKAGFPRGQLALSLPGGVKKRSGFGGRVAARKAGGGAKLGPNNLGIRAGGRLRRRCRRRARLLGQL